MEKQAAALRHFGTIFTILLWNGLTTPLAHSHPVVQYWENEYNSSSSLILQPRISSYSTHSHFGPDSRRMDLANNLSVSRWYFDVKGNFAINDEITLYGRLSLLSTKINNPVTASTSAFGFSDQLLGAAYRYYYDPRGLRMTLQADVTIPAYSNGHQKAEGQPYLGDGSFDYVLGTFVQYPFDFLSKEADWFGELGAAFRFRTKGYSSAIPFSFMIKRQPQNDGAMLEVGLRGQFSLNTDGTTAVAASTDRLLGAAGSDLVNAVNPAWMIAHVLAGYKVGSQSFYGIMGLPLSGTNAPSGFQISLGAKFDLGAPPEPRVHKASIPDSTRKEAEKKEPEKKEIVAASATVQNDRGHPPRSTRGRTTHDSVDSLSYKLNAEVTSVNDSLHLVKIDMGSSDGIAKGQTFDIFRFVTDPETGRRKEERVARAEVLSVKSSEAALNVVEYFIDQWVDKGFIARRLVK